MDDSRDNLPASEQIDVTIDIAAGAATMRCIMEVLGASIVADDGRVLAGQTLRGFGAVASVMERKLREEYEPLRLQVEQHSGWLEVMAIWDGDELIDGDGANLAAMDADNDEEDYPR